METGNWGTCMHHRHTNMCAWTIISSSKFELELDSLVVKSNLNNHIEFWTFQVKIELYKQELNKVWKLNEPRLTFDSFFIVNEHRRKHRGKFVYYKMASWFEWRKKKTNKQTTSLYGGLVQNRRINLNLLWNLQSVGPLTIWPYPPVTRSICSTNIWSERHVKYVFLFVDQT